MSDEPSARSLAARLQMLEDERAILRTLHQYGLSMDYGPDGEFIDCFTPEGVWDVRMRKSPAGSFQCRGHAEIMASLASQTEMRAPLLFAKHFVMNPQIAVTGDEASVQSYFLRVEPRNAGATEIVASGRYLDRLVRCADEHWRFIERIAEIDDM